MIIESVIEHNGCVKAHAGESVAAPPMADDTSDSPPFLGAQWEPDYDSYEQPEIAESEWPFKCLGHDHGQYFFIAQGGNQIICLKASGLAKANLMMLAGLDWWYANFPKIEKEKIIGVKWDMAADEIIKRSHAAGVFNPDERQRGAGVWKEKLGPVIHCGDKLIYQGKNYDAFNFKSYFIYESAPRRFDLAERGLTDLEAKKLYNICIAPSWKNENSGKILAGWIIMAMICGCLDWRSHIWIMGSLGSGKSFIINDILKPALVGVAKFLGAGSTEAGIRQSIKNDALPVIMDEMEGESLKDNEVLQSILAMSRRSSSGQTMAKGSSEGIAQSYNLMSCFCFASINHGISHGADESRISVLEIEPDKRTDAQQRFEDLEIFVRETLTPEYSRMLLRRTIDALPAILKNIKTFHAAIRKEFGNSRSAQQLAPLLAGVYSLLSTGLISRETAEKWIKENDLKPYTANDAEKDHEKLFDYLMTTKIKITGQHKTHETQIAKAIAVALGRMDADYTLYEARTALENIDIKVRDSVWIKRPSQHINKILKGTPWAVSWPKSMALNSFVEAPEVTGRIGAGNPTKYLIINPDKFKRETLL